MKYRILILLILMLPIKAYALELVTIDFDCNANGNTNYTCDVWGNSEEIVQAVDFKVSLPSYVTASEFILEENDFGSGENNWISVIFDEPISGHFKIGTLNLTTNEEVKEEEITINDLIVVDNNYQKVVADSKDETNVNKSNNQNYLVIIIVVCAIIILILVGFIYKIIRVRKLNK